MSQADTPNEAEPKPRDVPAPSSESPSGPHPAIPLEDDPAIEETEEQPS